MSVLAALPATPHLAAQRDGDKPAEVVETGAETYLFHCASCHGRRGKGDGAVASALKTRPPDLTTMARRRGGRFPRAEVTDFIFGRGRQVVAHGPADMPVWGPLFRELNPFDSRVDVRAARLVAHLESPQVK